MWGTLVYLVIAGIEAFLVALVLGAMASVIHEDFGWIVFIAFFGFIFTNLVVMTKGRWRQ